MKLPFRGCMNLPFWHSTQLLLWSLVKIPFRVFNENSLYGLCEAVFGVSPSRGFMHTVEIALIGTSFEQSPAIYGHFLLSGPTFHIYYMANLFSMVYSHFLGNFCGYNNVSSHHICPTSSLTGIHKCPQKTWSGLWVDLRKFWITVKESKNDSIHICHEITYIKSIYTILIWKYFEMCMKTGCFRYQWADKKAYLFQLYLQVRELVNREGKNCGVYICHEYLSIFSLKENLLGMVTCLSQPFFIDKWVATQSKFYCAYIHTYPKESPQGLHETPKIVFFFGYVY